MLQAIQTRVSPGGLDGHSRAYIERLEEELLLAWEVQSGLFPTPHPERSGIDLEVRCAPARAIGGDFYDFVRYGEKAITAGALGDVSGKGPSAAIYAALVMGLLRSFEAQELGPAEMLRALNQALLKRPVAGKFISLLYATWNERDRSFTVANSGLPYPIWVRGEQVIQVEAAGLPLGMFEEVEYEEHTLQCRLGDVLVFFTDGITEAIDSYGNEFGRPRLERLVRDHHHGTAEHILKSLFGAVEAHAHGAEAFDDQSVIVIKT